MSPGDRVRIRAFDSPVNGIRGPSGVFRRDDGTGPVVIIDQEWTSHVGLRYPIGYVFYVAMSWLEPFKPAKPNATCFLRRL